MHLQVEQTASITWTPCGNVQCASLSVPLDCAPDRRALHACTRPPSGHRTPRRVLFTNPGGPADRASISSGTRLRVQARDLESVRHRVVGSTRCRRSDPIDCGNDLDAFDAVHRDPTTPTQVAENVQASRDVRRRVRPQQQGRPAVRLDRRDRDDIDAIRAAMGEDTSATSASRTGLLSAPCTPRVPAAPPRGRARRRHRPRAVVPRHDARPGGRLRACARRLLRLVRPTTDCGLRRREPAHGLRRRCTRLDPEPIPGNAERRVADAWARRVRHRCREPLTTAHPGTRAWVPRWRRRRGERATAPPISDSTPAANPTGSTRTRPPPSTRGLYRLARAADPPSVEQSPTPPGAAPHFGATTVWLGLPCTYWPAPPVETGAGARAGAPLILVVGTTNDPATPYAWAQSLARHLESGHLLTWDGEGHPAYGRGSDCIDSAVDDYLLDLHGAARRHPLSLNASSRRGRATSMRIALPRTIL